MVSVFEYVANTLNSMKIRANKARRIDLSAIVSPYDNCITSDFIRKEKQVVLVISILSVISLYRSSFYPTTFAGSLCEVIISC